MRQIRFLAIAVICFVAALFGALLSPSTWLHKSLAVFLCGVLSANPALCTNNAIAVHSQEASATNPVKVETTKSSDLLTQRSRDFDDDTPKSPPRPNPKPPSNQNDSGANIPLRRPDFDDVDSLSKPTQRELDKNFMVGTWLYSIYTSSSDNAPIFSSPVEIAQRQNKYMVSLCRNAISQKQPTPRNGLLQKVINGQSITETFGDITVITAINTNAQAVGGKIQDRISGETLFFTMERQPSCSSQIASLAKEKNLSENNIAQFGIPNIPIPSGSIEGLIKGAVADQVLKALGDTIQSEAPISSSAQDIFPTVSLLPGGAFNPTGNIQQIFQQLQTSRDGNVMLEPGDYLIPISVFCMKHSASSPSGHRYLLAPLKGRMADVIIALNSRSIGSGIPHQKLQALSWNIQAGVKYEEMSVEIREIVDRFLPDFKERMSRSFYEQIQATWSQLSSTVPGLPSFDSALGQLGGVGQTINTLRQTRDTLIRYGNNFEALSRMLVTSGTSDSLGGSANTPWSKINDRVYGRMITESNYSGPAQLQLRVLANNVGIDFDKGVLIASTQLSNSLIALSPSIAPIVNLVADPQNQGIQPLSMSPDTNLSADMRIVGPRDVNNGRTPTPYPTPTPTPTPRSTPTLKPKNPNGGLTNDVFERSNERSNSGSGFQNFATQNKPPDIAVKIADAARDFATKHPDAVTVTSNLATGALVIGAGGLVIAGGLAIASGLGESSAIGGGLTNSSQVIGAVNKLANITTKVLMPLP